ncbi:dienelactone hydrolase family protein [Herbaspirillum sp. RTI4]|uniref:dienelactone hydrolase family protein n=1 Tax=Herbaspirillum sp. RTI4 TaxID=3048640 RepID=UPI002AB3F87B|nr:dienelactone hydrolase family protein [Herbaspirillum sp. RTI4]MDY7577571.1 dienelactone hydrolase family protein [Herbaspirillum sp. RTI4]MEA9981046.1 dienelactone hydrolase family protein [Herbaspirillum sp. RTI4]
MNDVQRDLDSLVGTNALFEDGNRRAFLKTALGASFAAAVSPVMAQTVIHTDSVGLEVFEVGVMVDGQRVPAYVAKPAGKTHLPVVLVISEIFGVHAHIADIARRFAKQGYLAIAPELFIRQGDPSAYPTITELNEKIISKTPDAQVLGDLDAYVDWAKDNGGDMKRLGINGFCWGGRITWLYCAHNPQVKAGVVWYGKPEGEKSALMPANPIDIAATLKVPVLGMYGGKDAGIPVASVQRLKAALEAAGNRSEFVVFPNSGHAFNADYRPSYVAADAKDGWQRALTWLRSHGV